MSKLIKHEENIDVWKKADVIKQLFAPQLTKDEFMYFMGLGKSLQANPFKKEIWAVKYSNKPAQVFLARDFYRKTAQEQDNYNGHFVDAVYENDDFRFNSQSGIPDHEYTLKDRGKLIGAFGLAWRKGVTRPLYIYIEFTEYNQGQALWKTKPATMIKKVVEAQILRMTWQGLFSGTYSEDEQKIIEGDNSAGLNETYKLTPPVIKGEGREGVLIHKGNLPDSVEEEKTEVIEVEDDNKKDTLTEEVKVVCKELRRELKNE